MSFKVSGGETPGLLTYVVSGERWRDSRIAHLCCFR